MSSSALKDTGHIYRDEATLKAWLASIGRRDYFHPGIVVRHSPIAGYGLFASVPIVKGELISYEDVNDYLVLNREVIESLSPEDQDWWWHFCYQVGDDAWLGPRSREVIKRKMTFFENHSCDPSTWFEDDITMTARRDIAVGEEITYDYSTTESYIDPEMETVVCRCGTPVCRGRMLGDEWKRPELQERYGTHWMGYLLAKVLEQRGDHAGAAAVTARTQRLLAGASTAGSDIRAHAQHDDDDACSDADSSADSHAEHCADGDATMAAQGDAAATCML